MEQQSVGKNKRKRLAPLRVHMAPINSIGGPPIFSHKAPSEEFLEAIQSPEGPDSATCFFCGRVHFSAEAKKPKNLLSNHILHEASSLTIGFLEKRIFVFDCPCNAAAIYEKLFCQHLRVFAKYSQAWARTKLEKAQEKLDLANSIVPE